MTTSPNLPQLPPEVEMGRNRNDDAAVMGYTRAQVDAIQQAMVEWAASVAENTEAGDGSHDYNAGAETMSENIVRALRSSLKAAESATDGVPVTHQRQTPCKHCNAKQGEEHSVTCPYGVALPAGTSGIGQQAAAAPIAAETPTERAPLVGWVRDEDGDMTDPLFLRGAARPPRDLNSHYRPVIYATGAVEGADSSRKEAIQRALDAPGCERLREFYEVGPVQRAAVESFADAVAGADSGGKGVGRGWPAYRLLTTADMIQAGDECLSDDTVTWVPLAGWEVGMRWHNGLMPLRRLQSPSLNDDGVKNG